MGKDPDAPGKVPAARPEGPLSATAEPPVVARLVIEIRSDGSRTIARGVAEDLERGERVSLEASGATPLALAFSLLGQLNQIPSIARSFARNLLGGPKK
jgi:hypothetical protein